MQTFSAGAHRTAVIKVHAHYAKWQMSNHQLTYGEGINCRQPVSPQSRLLIDPALMSGAVDRASDLNPTACNCQRQVVNIVPCRDAPAYL